jgi:asparagine synthase (glutamine-hydrolysing)
VELSGGFDSTTIATIAAEIGDPSELITYALNFPGHDCDESAYIEAAEVHIGVRSRRLDALAVDPYDFSGSCRDSLDLAVLADTEWCTPLLRLAASDSCRVVLTGQGGDHALQGSPRAVTYNFLAMHKVRSAWRSLKNERCPKRVAIVALAQGMVLGHAARHESGVVARLLSRYSRFRLARQDDSARTFLGPSLRECLSASVPPDTGADPFDVARSRRRRHYTGGMNYFIGSWDDSAIDGGIEYRHPFLDVRVIEFVVRLGEDVIAAGGRSRSLHRQAFGDVLPQPTLDRTDKAAFDIPWMNAALRPALFVGESENETLSAFIDQDALRASTAAYTTDASLEFDTWSWWGAVAVGLWSLNCPPS